MRASGTQPAWSLARPFLGDAAPALGFTLAGREQLLPSPWVPGPGSPVSGFEGRLDASLYPFCSGEEQ